MELIKKRYLFEANSDLFGILRGCSDEELDELNAYYNYQLPNYILEIMKVGGYNFFNFALGIEWQTGYFVWKSTIRHERKYAYQPDFLFFKNRFYLAQAADLFLYCLFCQGENPKVYQIEYTQKGQYEEMIAYDKLSDLVKAVINYQNEEYEKYLARPPYQPDTHPSQPEALEGEELPF